MSKPIAVLISDIHYNINTLPLADAAMRMAITKANDLDVPLIVAGDLHDTKANLRGECVNAMIETFDLMKNNTYILRGNHDSINEKSTQNSLSFLNRAEIETNDGTLPSIEVINYTRFTNNVAVKRNSLWFIPYQHDPAQFKKELKKVENGAVVICHQGITGSISGEYIQDKSAITKEDVAGFRVISGHYHTRQTIKLPEGGTWDYLGNPYTLGFGEANDPPKGFQVLMDDGSLEFVPTNLRKHKMWDIQYKDIKAEIVMLDEAVNWKQDLLWIKIRGTKEELSGLTKDEVTSYFNMSQHPYRLDLIPTDTNTSTTTETAKLSDGALLDSLIDSLTNTSEEQKERLKTLWKDLK